MEKKLTQEDKKTEKSISNDKDGQVTQKRQTSFRIPVPLLKDFKKVAIDKGTTINNLVVKVIEDFIKKNKKKNI